MYLKRIELTGFKSFPDHTEVVLSSGITSVVGPNGCGKSNLMDAVRWVLGEQRPRILRGGKMEEVIFGGTPQRQAVSAAEVMLIVDNQSSRLPTEYAEVSISRRLDRSGDSEYRLNGQVCRLKDINDLFLDTGMGSHGYSVIQSGMIDSIISENPEERRFLFEEAAGVSKYKLRQREALRKMAVTDQDLLRLLDLRNEVQTRVRSLARQKGMAQRHQRLRDKWCDLDIALAHRIHRRLLEQQSTIEQSLATTAETVMTYTATTDALELEAQSLRLAVDEADRLAQEASDRVTQAATFAQEQKSEHTRLQDRLAHLTEEQQRHSNRITHLSKRRTEAETDLRRAELEQTEADQSRERIAVRATELEGELIRAQEAADRSAGELKEARDRWQAAEHACLKATSERDALADRREEFERFRSERLTQLTRYRESLSQSEASVKGIESSISNKANAFDKGQRQLQELEQQRLHLSAELTQTENTLHSQRERVAEYRARHTLMAELIERGEGLGSAASHVLGDSDRWVKRVTAWIDRMRPESQWRRAVEAVLADRLGALCCDDSKTVSELMDYLQSKAVGRATLFDPSMIRSQSEKQPRKPDHPAFAGWLSDHIECDPSDKDLVNALFGNVACVTSAAEVRDLFDKAQGVAPVVAMDGTTIQPPGMITVGASEAEPIVGRRERLEKLKEAAVKSEREAHASEERLVQLRSRVQELTERIQSETNDSKQLESDIAALRIRTETENARCEEFRRMIDDLTSGQTGSYGDKESSNADSRSLEELVAERDNLAAALDTVNGTAESADAGLRKCTTDLNQTRVAVVEAQAKAEAIANECRRLRDVITEWTTEEQELATRLEEIETETVSIKKQTHRLAEEVAQSEERVEVLDVERRERRATLAQHKEKLTALEDNLRKARHQRDTAEKERSRIEIERSSLTSEIQQCVQRARDTHDTDLTRVTVEDPSESDEELRHKVTAARQSIERLGPVNPLALQEWEQEKDRLEFLDKQIGDLQEAKKSLTQTINELNTTAGRRFVETFDTARGHFQNVFTELFRGGEADVRLTNPDDPLESPIEVYARPRGKKFIGIRQLSGGERALTALALLFALYLVKPSPFCILDEVDAPLDDANCGRFLRLLDKFKQNTQFIIVTHNKLTMDAADVLYGVTMENPGISKLVSVRLTHGPDGGNGSSSTEDEQAAIDSLTSVSS